MAEHSIKPEVKLLTKKEVAAIYRVSMPTIDNMMKIGRLKYYKIGSLVRFRSDELPILSKSPG